MTKTLQELVDERASAWDSMTTINDRMSSAEKPAGEDVAAYEKAEKDYDRLDSEIDRRERHEAKAAANGKVDRSKVVGPDPEGLDDDGAAQAYAEAFEIFVRNGLAEMDQTHRAALKGGFKAYDPKEVKNAAGIGTASAGGYLVPPEFRRQVVERMKAFGAVAEVAEVIETETGATLPWPTNDDTGNVGSLLAENTAATEQDFVFGTAQVGAYKYTTKIVRASLEFLQDVDWIDAERWIARKFAERLARIHNIHYTTGTGSSQPLGIVTGATVGVTAASATAITADEFIDLQHSVDPAYRNERAKFMLTDAALKGARKLKYTGSGEYIFQPSVTAGVPSLIAGAGYVVNQDMAVPATGVKSVLFGDFETAYLVRRVKALELMQLRERYAEFGQVGFIGFDREDGTVQDANAYRALQQL
jgi:HK97 family phage major capsid protein